MNYADKLKSKSTKINTNEPILKNTLNEKRGRPKKPKNELRNKALPIALNEKEKTWIEEQAKQKSDELGFYISTSSWIRMVLLKDMPKN